MASIAASRRVVVVLGASGTIGTGLIRACLDSSHVAKVVGVFRSEASLDTSKKLLGNPPEDKFIPVLGNLASEQDASDLLKSAVAKVGEITDVVASIGRWISNGPSILDQPLEDLRYALISNKIEPHFYCAKTFIPYLCDRPNTSYTIVNGGVANRVIPKCGIMTVGHGALAKLSKVLFNEYKDKNVRLNEFMIDVYVRHWDSLTSESVSNHDVGKALLGVILHPAARCLSMMVRQHNMESLASEGITDELSNN